MKVYVVVRETNTGSQVLGVFPNEHDAVECVNKAHERFALAQLKDDTLRESCYITDQFLIIRDDTAINLAKDNCPKPDGFFHQTDESIYCMGFVEGYETAIAKNT
jgi:hypothetical protein